MGASLPEPENADKLWGVRADSMPRGHLGVVVKSAGCVLFQAQEPVQNHTLRLVAG